MNLVPRRILITGGAGFLGSHLCERLLGEGHDVLCVDNFYTSTRHNITHLLDHPNFELMRHDVTFPLYVEVDQIYNMACPASPIHYQRDPVQTTKTSVHGAINMLGLAKRTKATILQASTSEVYGDPEMHPQPESYWGNVNPVGVRSCYDEGKRCAETLFFDYLRQHDMPIKVARIFNTYGPRMLPNDGRVVSNFIVQHHGNIVHADQHSDPQAGIFVQRVEFELEGFALDRDAIPAKLAPIADHYVHIDLMVCMLAEKLAAVCLDTTDPEIVDWLKAKKIEIVPVGYRETMELGCNVMSLGNDRVLSTAKNSDLNARLRAQGFTVYDPQVDIFTRGGGGVHCMAQALRRDPS